MLLARGRPWGVARRIFNDSDPKEWSWPVKLRILCGRREPTDFVAPDPKVPSKMHEYVAYRLSMVDSTIGRMLTQTPC